MAALHACTDMCQHVLATTEGHVRLARMRKDIHVSRQGISPLASCCFMADLWQSLHAPVAIARCGLSTGPSLTGESLLSDTDSAMATAHLHKHACYLSRIVPFSRYLGTTNDARQSCPLLPGCTFLPQ